MGRIQYSNFARFHYLNFGLSGRGFRSPQLLIVQLCSSFTCIFLNLYIVVILKFWIQFLTLTNSRNCNWLSIVNLKHL